MLKVNKIKSGYAMKFKFISVLAITLAMLVIPLLSLADTPKTAIQTAVSTDGITYEKPKSNLTFDSFKVLKDGNISEISAEDYIFGVVAAEMPALYHEEALKAQAVAAYTFACYRKANNTNSNYDIAADPETAQCYITKEEAAARWGEKADEYSAKIKNCVDAVKGEWLSFGGAPIFAAYHAISAGTTNVCSDVWGTDLDYLKSVDSSSDLLADGYLSEVSFSSDELASKLNDISQSSGEAQNYFSDIKTTDNGYVKEICYCGKKTTGSDISKLLGLRSADFKISFSEGSFTFTVKGYGHGVGMSQWGANCMAKQGSSYKEILLHYYNCATLEKTGS